MKDWNPAKWVRIVVPAVLILVWLAIAGFGGPTFGKISGVSTNDQAGFLPENAQSTEVNELQKQFQDSTNIPAIVLFETDGSVSREDLASFAELPAELNKVSGIAAAPSGQTSSVVGPIPSEDGQAVEFIVPLDDEGNSIREIVKDIRDTVAKNTPSGYTAYVTGPAGLLADLVNGFAGIDGILLIVALLAVFVILLIVYRSLLLPVLVLLTSVFALSGAILGIYYLALNGVIKVSGQSQGILSILVIGAATDYALLLVARYREALQQVPARWAAMGRAFKGAFEPILASAGTVILALLCLLFSDLNSNKALGPIAAFGVGFAFLAAVTFLPALLLVFGRAAFWPFVPRVQSGVAAESATQPTTKAAVTSTSANKSANTSPKTTQGKPEIAGLEGIKGLWRAVGSLIARRPRATWIVTLLALLLCVAALPSLKANGVPQTDLLLSQSQAVDGQEQLAKHFDAGSGSPVIIITKEQSYLDVITAAEQVEGVASAEVKTPPMPQAPPGQVVAQVMPAPTVVDGNVMVMATLSYQADSAEAEQVVTQLREKLPPIDSTVLVGGVTAIALDTNLTAQSDLVKIVPIVLLVIFLVLMLLLRSIVAPLILIVSVVVSYAATLGVSALVFNYVFGFPGADASVPLFGFVFLVALGIDYNIFLMTRVREESLARGTRPGILRGLAVTGGVITSAGVVLAATFAALGVIPILFLAQLAFIVAFGVVLDTVIVRTLLVPAFSYDVGRAIWWPSKLARKQ